MIHLLLHFFVPLTVAMLFFRPRWKLAFVIMMVTMVVDVDHLLADPIYDPNRCSIGFHPLHRLYVIPFYFILAAMKKTRWVGLGLVIHMVLDSIDCQVTNSLWYQP